MNQTHTHIPSKLLSVRLLGLRYALLVCAVAVPVTGMVVWLGARVRNLNFAERASGRARILSANVGTEFRSAARGENLRALSRQLAHLRTTDDLVGVWIYDANGQFIWSSFGTGETESVFTASASPLHDRGQTVIQAKLRGIPVTAVALPIIETDGAVVGQIHVAYDRSWLRQEFLTDLSLGVVFIVTLAATSLLLGWRIGDLLAARLNVLRQGLLDVRNGNLAVKLDIPKETELADITHNFNAMTAELASYRRQVENHEAQLQQRIAEACSQLEESHRQLAEAERLAAVGELAAGVAHEISNPLTSIHLRAQLLLDAAPDDASQQKLRDILEQSFRCQVTLRGLVSYASQANMPVKTSIDIAQLLNHCAKHAMPSGDGTSRRDVRLDVPTDLPPVPGDPSRLEHVVNSLLEMALKAGAPDSPITVNAQLQGTMLHIVIGTRVKSAARSSGETGGFALCRAFIRDHSGTLETALAEKNTRHWTIRLPADYADSNRSDSGNPPQ